MKIVKKTIKTNLNFSIMKKAIFTLAFILTVSLLAVSCTTDSYDAEMDRNNTSIQTDDIGQTDAETDPVIIPKKD
jgi:hypothetical protein